MGSSAMFDGHHSWTFQDLVKKRTLHGNARLLTDFSLSVKSAQMPHSSHLVASCHILSPSMGLRQDAVPVTRQMLRLKSPTLSISQHLSAGRINRSAVASFAACHMCHKQGTSSANTSLEKSLAKALLSISVAA